MGQSKEMAVAESDEILARIEQSRGGQTTHTKTLQKVLAAL